MSAYMLLCVPQLHFLLQVESDHLCYEYDVEIHKKGTEDYRHRPDVCSTISSDISVPFKLSWQTYLRLSGLHIITNLHNQSSQDKTTRC